MPAPAKRASVAAIGVARFAQNVVFAVAGSMVKLTPRGSIHAASASYVPTRENHRDLEPGTYEHTTDPEPSRSRLGQIAG